MLPGECCGWTRRNDYLQGIPKEATLCRTNIARSARGFDPVPVHDARACYLQCADGPVRITGVGATTQVLQGEDAPFWMGAITSTACKVIYGKYGIKWKVTWHSRTSRNSDLSARLISTYSISTHWSLTSQNLEVGVISWVSSWVPFSPKSYMSVYLVTIKAVIVQLNLIIRQTCGDNQVCVLA